MMRIRTALLAVTAGAGLTAVVACGSYNTAPAAKAPAANAPAGAPSASTGTLRLNAINTGQLGTVVTDGGGLTLYRFDKDTASPSTSNCNGACATTWPPALVSGSGTVRLSGVPSGLVGSVTRADGSEQITLNGWPLYRFAKDSQPGDTKGQGVGGTWFAATPQGKKAAAQSTVDNSKSGYGY
jgi:predicted lipoprotein with Yx(FWY)xxD motif